MKKYIFLTIATLALTACTQEERSTEPVEIALSAQTAGIQAGTRAGTSVQTSQVAEGQHVGVYIYDAATTATTYSTGYTKSNLNYEVTDDEGTLSINQTLYFPNDDNGIKVFAYTPYNSTWNMSGANAFTVAEDQSEVTAYKASDLMMGHANGGSTVERTKAAIPITLDHLFSKVTVKLLKGAGLDDLKTVDYVYIKNTFRSCTVTTENNLWKKTETTGSVSDITVGTFNEDYADCSAIVVPQTVDEGKVFIQVHTNTDGTFNYKLPEDLTLEKGKEYIYTITIGLYELIINNVTVTPWTDAFDNGSTGKAGSVTL